MATGPADSWTFEVFWDGSSWTDESTYLRASDSAAVRITRGRATEADDIQAGVLSGVLDNTTGRFTPDSPLSALYPLVEDGAFTRFKVFKGASSWFRHRGRIYAGQPTHDDGSTATASVPFESVGELGAQAGVNLHCDFVERWLQTAETSAVDLWPFEGTSPTNIGNGGGTARLAQAKTGAGSWETSSPEGVMLDSQLTLTAAGSVGPSVRLSVGSAVTASNMIVIPFRTAARTPTTPAAVSRAVAVGYDSAGAQVWALRLKDNGGACDLNLYDESDAFVGNVYFGFSAANEDAGDDQWFCFSIEGTTWYLRRSNDGVLQNSGSAAAFDATLTRRIVLGGQASVSFGAVVVSNSTTTSEAFYLTPGLTESSQDRFVDMNLYGNFASTQNGAANRPVAMKPTGGRTSFDVIAEVCRTVGATVVETQTQSNHLTFYDSDTLRLPAVALTVDVEADLAADFTWRKGDVPSSVTATYPGGQVTVTDATRPRVDESLDTCAADEVSARDVASSRVTSSRRLRLTRLVIDLAASANNLWADVMALEIGDRIRVTLGSSSSLLVAQYGYTYVDVYAAGWTETYWQGGALFEIDTIPADDPVEFEFDSTTRGRFCADGTMTVTGGTAVGTTSTGTVIVTTSSGPAITVDSTAYPITFDWQGEYVTVTNPPASSTSPQTLTITARGVAPTVARVHATGETFDVAYAPAFTF